MITPAAPRTNIALIVSLCVNLLLAGVIATAAVRHFTQPPEGPVVGGQSSGQPPGQQPPERAQLRQLLSPRFLTRMAPEQESKIRQIIDAHRQKLDALKAEANAGRRDVLALFSAPVLDKDALAKAFVRTQVADAAVETEVMHISAEIAPVLSPDQRKKAADWRGQHMMGGGPMGWRPGTGDGRDGDHRRHNDRD